MTEQEKENLIRAAHAGGIVLRSYFGKALNLVEKSMPSDVQTEADTESEKAILEILTTEFPSYGIHAEESGEIKNNSEYTFYIDPLDGTNNFVIGLPFFTVSIGLLKGKKLVAAVVYNPILDQTYYAEAGKGAWLNGEKIKVSQEIEYNKCTISACFPYMKDKNYAVNIVTPILLATPKRMTWNWSIANDLCLLASGKIEAMFCHAGNIYDYAAGKLIALEAGAKIISFDGKTEIDATSNKFIISNSEKTNSKIFELVKDQVK